MSNGHNVVEFNVVVSSRSKSPEPNAAMMSFVNNFYPLWEYLSDDELKLR